MGRLSRQNGTFSCFRGVSPNRVDRLYFKLTKSAEIASVRLRQDVSAKPQLSGGAIMLLWHRDSQPGAGVAEGVRALPTASSEYEAKRQRALQILGERWLLHHANAPDRRPARSVLARGRADAA
jgi:hypothetical protein